MSTENEEDLPIYYCPCCSRRHELHKDKRLSVYHCFNCGREFVIVILNEEAEE